MVTVQRYSESKSGVLEELPLSRGELLEYVRDVLSVAFEKMRRVNCKESDRQVYMRIVNNSIGVATPLIRDQDLESLKQEIAEVKLALNLR